MIDIIILAAGRGSRLAGVMPPYMKPLMTVNGESILVKLIKEATAAVFNVTASDDRVTVVTAPENTMPIAHLLNDADVGLIDVDPEFQTL
jgi:CTP:molybdopterin cytidylyltransferase MocA